MAVPHEGRRDHFQLFAGEVADDGLARELLPPRFGLAVVHDEVAVSELSGRAEIEQASVQPAVEGDGRVAERTEGDRHRKAVQGVVDNLVPGQDLEGIGLGLSLVLDDDDGLDVFDPLVGRFLGHELRLVDGGDAVLRRASGEDLLIRNRMLLEVRLPPQSGEERLVAGGQNGLNTRIGAPDAQAQDRRQRQRRESSHHSGLPGQG